MDISGAARSTARVGRLSRGAVIVLGCAAALGLVLLSGATVSAASAQPTVNLGNATPFAVLAGTTVTNTGASVVSGDLGVDPGSAVTGFPPGQLVNGTQQTADSVALSAQSALTTAYLDAAGRTPFTVVSADLGGQTLDPGVYKDTSGLALTGTLTLDAQNNPNAVFIFQATSTLITASNSTVILTGGAQACNVFWQVGSSATLGTGTSFAGNVLALTAISVETGASVRGRVLAQNGGVSLDDNSITVPTCNTTLATPTPTPTATPTPSVPVPNTGADIGNSSGGLALVVGLAAVLAGLGLALTRRIRLRTRS
ncbi:MAG TPA: ice-binding family protein [Candidatus Nanopelagicaceae bacterium]|nr:ice-binding family protein [Candidatus Nanopelagicaceae bacterium]